MTDHYSNTLTQLSNYLNFYNGFYIEAGANDGITQSFTANLEKSLNWKGLLIEPNASRFDVCTKNRSIDKNIFVNCALVSNEYTDSIVSGSFANDGKCTFEGQITTHIAPHFWEGKIQELDSIRSNRIIVSVPAKSLQSILDKNNIHNIDFLSLDVENYEEEALRGLDFNKNSPKFMLIESGNNRKREKYIEKYLKQFKYELVFIEGNDSFFKLLN